jgi:hypothetical protein
MKTKWIMSLCFFACLGSNLAFAGNSVGNGGKGVRIENKVYLLDLVEAGVELTVGFNPNVQAKPDIVMRISKSLPAKYFPVDLIAQKLTEIKQVDALLAEALILTINSFQWRIVNSKLLDIKDDDSSLNYDPQSLVQIAIRKLRSIMIARDVLPLMDAENIAALVIHEACFALIQPNDEGKQESVKAREVTGYLFSEEFVTTPHHEDLSRITWKRLPSTWSGLLKWVGDKADEDPAYFSSAITTYYNSVQGGPVIKIEFTDYSDEKYMLFRPAAFRINRSDDEYRKVIGDFCKYWGENHFKDKKKTASFGIKLEAVEIYFQTGEEDSMVKWKDKNSARGYGLTSVDLSRFSKYAIEPKNCETEAVQAAIEYAAAARKMFGFPEKAE